ncbi:asparagine synthase (glutamine-hydrolyzing) [Sulfurimonas sp. MAG313]|nr:asparagine synthase (glutamine-hydrolyzing) [Sulfurimonas sp. MAG313]MDF1881183.1 asparagine synthase (glutamine-hydrolyzing) [Sulfurimonas sp. MAG313]
MCAIFGIIGEYDSLKARESIGLLSHRGPDYCGLIEKPNLFIAHNRLSIVDLDERASQPMIKDEIIVSFNGEIYNFKTLKKELDSIFDTSSDTEVLLRAYQKWGLSFVDKLEGMFAIALYDKGRLYLFRDRLGKKPLYYMQTEKSFIFASEIKALRPFLKKIKLNKDALHSYLSFLAPTPPHTFYQGIQKLESGQGASFIEGNLEIFSYYELLPRKISIHTKDEALKTLEKRLEESIEKRLMGDVEIACLLSGGLDSSLIAAMASKMGVKLKTFSLGYEGYAKYDERKYAREVTQYLDLENIEVEMSKEMFFKNLDKVMGSLDEPINDPASVPLYTLFERVKEEGIKVVLSGEGADELFLGYRHYFEYMDIQKAGDLKHKNWLKNHLNANFSQHREWEWYKRVFNDEVLFRSSGEKFTDTQKNILMKENIEDGFSMKYFQKYRDRFKHFGCKDESQWYSYLDLKHFQAEHFLTKLDRVSMAHGIEGRTPFLDHTLVETVFSLTPKLRYEEGLTKDLLKRIAKPYLPESIIHRKKKGFASPYLEWLLEENALERMLLVNKRSKIFHEDVLKMYIEKAKKGQFKQHVYGLYIFSLWWEKNN